MKHLLVLGLLLAGAARAADHPDFSGTWTLDLAASDSVDELMRAQGQSWLNRRVAHGMAVQQVIVQKPDALVVDLDSTLKHKHEVFPIGGDFEARVSDEAGAIKVRTAWSSDGSMLVTSTQLTLKDGAAAELDVQRALVDRALVQTIELRRPGQPPLRARRVFRRKPT